VRAKVQTYEEAAASVAFTESDLADAIERVVGTATQTAQHRSHDELRRLVRMLDVRIALVEREDGRTMHVTGNISVPELSALVRA
jgi:activator of HSP90 ATPase